jgi:uncharacterized membrane protein
LNEKDTSGRASTENGGPTPLENTDTTRLEAFSDGLFGVAITLLIIEIKVPQLDHATASGTDLLRVLMRQLPSLVAYVISFISILIMWIDH